MWIASFCRNNPCQTEYKCKKAVVKEKRIIYVPKSILPRNAVFAGANFSDYYIRPGDGLVLNRYASSASPSGAFNGSGTGNKGCLAFSSFGGLTQGKGMQISRLRQITVTCRTARTTADPSVNKLGLNIYVKHVPGNVWTPNTPGTDADCVLVVDNNPTGISQNIPSTFTTYILNSSDAIWKAALGPTHSMPPNIFTTGAPLSQYTNSPTDTLFDGVVTDGGLPYQYNFGAICFTTGDSVLTNPTSIVISRVTISFAGFPTRVFDFS